MRHHSLFEVSVFSSKPKSLILGSHPSRLNTFLSDAWTNRGKKFSSAGQDSPRSQCRVRPVDLISPLLYPWLLSSTWIVVSVVIADTSLHILPEDKTETKMNQVITEGTVCRSHCSLGLLLLFSLYTKHLLKSHDTEGNLPMKQVRETQSLVSTLNAMF